jgi:DNA-binding NtrC family response regulator
MIRVVVADGDQQTRGGIAYALRRAGCSVRPCPGAMSLVRAIDDHERGCPGGRISLLVVAAPLPQIGGVEELARLGVFALGAPVIVTTRALTHAVERAAMAAGATLVLARGIDSTASAVRHVIEQEQRWGGEWVSTGLLERLRVAGPPTSSAT